MEPDPSPVNEIPTGPGNGLSTSPGNGIPTGPRRMRENRAVRDCYWEAVKGAHCYYKRRAHQSDRSDLAHHALLSHVAELNDSFPVNCKWSDCGHLSQDQEDLVDHLLHRHIGFTGSTNFLDVIQKHKNGPSSRRGPKTAPKPPVPPRHRPLPRPQIRCEWSGCQYRAFDSLKLACHAVSEHVSRRNLLSHTCEWASCGALFMTTRELADHLTQTHAGHLRMVICFCGEPCTKGKLEVHEKLCPVLKGDRIPITAPPFAPPPPPENLRISPTDDPQHQLAPPPGKRRRVSDEDMRSSPDSSQVTANEPRKVLPLKQGSISSFKDSFIHTETESHFDEEPGLDAVAPSKVPDIYISNPPEAEEPPAKAPIARVKQPPMLKKIERQRLLQQKRDEERQEKRAQEVQQRRQERQLKEQQQKEQQLKEQLKGRCQQWQDEVSQQGQLKQQQTELPQNTDQDYAEDHELLHEERMRMEIDSKQQASATSMEPLAASRHSFGAHQLRNLACDLANLSHTIELALDQLPDQYLDDLSVELENDWAITDMNTMLRGVLATYIHGGDEKWVNGDKWRKKPSPQPE